MDLYILRGIRIFLPLTVSPSSFQFSRMPSWKAKHWHISWRFLGHPRSLSHIIPTLGTNISHPWESRNIIDSKLAFLGDMLVSRRVIPHPWRPICSLKESRVEKMGRLIDGFLSFRFCFAPPPSDISESAVNQWKEEGNPEHPELNLYLPLLLGEG